MFVSTLFAAAFLALPLAVAAQATLHPDPSQANVAVPEASYVSALERYQPAAALPDAPDSPDKAWRAANQQVGTLRGHAGHLESDAPTPPLAPAATAPATTAPTMSAPADHGKHH